MPFKVPFLICFKIASLADLQDCLMGSVNVFLQVRHAEVFLKILSHLSHWTCRPVWMCGCASILDVLEDWCPTVGVVNGVPIAGDVDHGQRKFNSVLHQLAVVRLHLDGNVIFVPIITIALIRSLIPAMFVLPPSPSFAP